MDHVLLDFLSFRTFISEPILIIFYYVGAVLAPIGVWLGLRWAFARFHVVAELGRQGAGQLWQLLSPRQRTAFLAAFITALLLAELFWRMAFEFVIAFLQIRHALVHGAA